MLSTTVSYYWAIQKWVDGQRKESLSISVQSRQFYLHWLVVCVLQQIDPILIASYVFTINLNNTHTSSLIINLNKTAISKYFLETTPSIHSFLYHSMITFCMTIWVVVNNKKVLQHILEYITKTNYYRGHIVLRFKCP